MIETAFHKLVSDALVVAGKAIARVVPSHQQFRPEAAIGLPHVVYTLIGADRGQTDDGPAGNTTARYQLDYFASSLITARDLSDRVRLALQTYKGTIDGTPILLIQFANDTFGAGQTPAEAPEKRIVRFRQDLSVSYRERTSVT